MEILEFKLAGNSFGIPVDIVKEIIPYQEPTPVPDSNACVEGIFMPRDVIITAVDLAIFLNRDKTDSNGLFVITNYHNLDIAFHVDAALGIHRVGADEIVKLDNTLGVDERHIAKGIIRNGDTLIIVLDFNKIIAQLQPELLSEEEMAAILNE
ncbi:MAG: purine-binding chemotaxis protein CheW [Lachnospiraceae bacterium]|nr:purine-binding chemotaxis protein CheW [Lachnospiraceae bacterium]